MRVPAEVYPYSQWSSAAQNAPGQTAPATVIAGAGVVAAAGVGAELPPAHDPLRLDDQRLAVLQPQCDAVTGPVPPEDWLA